MPRIVAVVYALLALGEAGKPSLLAQRAEFVRASAQEFIGVTLMPDIEHDFVLGKLEYVKKRHRRFHRAEIGREMSAALGDRLIDDAAQFVAQDVEFASRTLFDIPRIPFFQHDLFLLRTVGFLLVLSFSDCARK